jgi:uncharacterized protein (DUF952 family)
MDKCWVPVIEPQIACANRTAMTPMTIGYKVLTTAEFAAIEADLFEGARIDRHDGYIHLSTGSQVTETVARHFAGQTGLVIAAIDLGALGDRVRWEPSRNGELFPHLYGRLPRSAVLAHRPVELGTDGAVRLPRPDRRSAPT